MRFNEKLQYLRKEKKLSQEQLADMLDVTRQSVSKWESGTTYPEMDKLIMLCKIFKVSLDDLTNDEVTEMEVEKKTTNSNTFSLNNILNGFLGFIGKTVKMFQAMSFGTLVKCIFSMLILACVLMLFHIPFEVMQDGFRQVVYNFGVNGWSTLLNAVFTFILEMIFVVLYLMIFIYIFKIAYLDKYEFVSTSDVEKTNEDIEEPKEKAVEKERIKETKVVLPAEPKDNVLFKILGGIALGFIKFLLACFAIGAIFFLIMLSFALAIDCYFISKGVVFIGILLAIIFAIILCAWFIEAISIFIFNRKIPFKRLLITFIVGILGLGISLGITLMEVWDVDYVDSIPTVEGVELETKEEIIPMTEKLAFDNYNNYYGYDLYYNFEYKVDESMTDSVSIQIAYYPDFIGYNMNISDEVISIHRYLDSDFNAKKKAFRIAIDNLKNKKIYNYDEFFFGKFVITSSSSNIEKLKSNSETRYRNEELRGLENHYQGVIQSYIERIDEYEQRIDEYDNKLDELNEENNILQGKIDELENYKSRVQGLIE